MYVNPQQELFTFFKVELEKLGYDVYEGSIPSDDTPYPFIYLGNIRWSINRSTKSHVLGDANLTIHVWSNKPDKRGSMSSMVAEVEAFVLRSKHTKHYKWECTDLTTNIIADNTTSIPLLHGVIDLTMELQGGF